MLAQTLGTYQYYCDMNDISIDIGVQFQSEMAELLLPVQSPISRLNLHRMNKKACEMDSLWFWFILFHICKYRRPKRYAICVACVVRIYKMCINLCDRHFVVCSQTLVINANWNSMSTEHMWMECVAFTGFLKNAITRFKYRQSTKL